MICYASQGALQDIVYDKHLIPEIGNRQLEYRKFRGPPRGWLCDYCNQSGAPGALSEQNPIVHCNMAF